MTRTHHWISNGIGLIVIAGVAVTIGVANHRAHAGPPASAAGSPFEGIRAPGTSPGQLRATIATARAHLAQRPVDARAAVVLADALMREARVSGNPGLAVEGEQALLRALADQPADYEARRMLAVVYLSEHRFRDAIDAGRRVRDLRPDDAWNYGVIGDAHIELGEYDAAFESFDRMMRLRPNAAAYGRAAYSLELRGRLSAALDAMRMAADATSPRDAESLAWHYSQIGDLYLQMGRRAEAEREYRRALASFPDHPFAQRGLARAAESRGDLPAAIAIYRAMMATAPSPDIAAKLGELLEASGDRAAAERSYALAESGWRFDAPQPAALARFLAEHGRDLEEAVRLAEGAAAERHDIFTDDALGWCYFKVGRIDDASTAMKAALRTGTTDRTVLYHAAAIRSALGDRAAARRLATRALRADATFDVRLAPALRALLERCDRPTTQRAGARP
ncbi:MAG TPA: tetratricopeptide repeat protein [Vicinamibacterales bacterium]|nr:tetratricopeptide repeat protein [Vicinamibacterales bacterium]